MSNYNLLTHVRTSLNAFLCPNIFINNSTILTCLTSQRNLFQYSAYDRKGFFSSVNKVKNILVRVLNYQSTAMHLYVKSGQYANIHKYNGLSHAIFFIYANYIDRKQQVDWPKKKAGESNKFSSRTSESVVDC